MAYIMLRRSRGYSNVSAVYPEDPVLTPSPPEHCSKGEKAEDTREDDAAPREKLQKISSAIALFTF